MPPVGQTGDLSGLTPTIVLASTATSGWCRVIGVPAGTPLDLHGIGLIQQFVLNAIVHDPQYQSFLINPFLAPLALQKIGDTVNAIGVGLQPYIGQPCESIPTNLTQLKPVHDTLPTNPADIIGQGLGTLIDWTGLGDVGVKLMILAGILVLIVLALKRVL